MFSCQYARFHVTRYMRSRLVLSTVLTLCRVCVVDMIYYNLVCKTLQVFCAIYFSVGYEALIRLRLSARLARLCPRLLSFVASKVILNYIKNNCNKKLSCFSNFYRQKPRKALWL